MKFHQAMKLRVADQRGGFMMYTGTPLHGLEAREAKQVTAIAEGSTAQNRSDPEDEKSPPLVSLHHCSMWNGGIVSHAAIRALTQGMDEFEVEARGEGKPAPLATNPVFDRKMLAENAESVQHWGTAHS